MRWQAPLSAKQRDSTSKDEAPSRKTRIDLLGTDQDPLVNFSSKPILVDLLVHYSKNSTGTRTAPGLRRLIAQSTGRKPTKATSGCCRRKKHLTDHDIQHILASYASGVTASQVATDYGISKTRVLNLLALHGIGIRYQPPTSTQIETAAKLYLSGDSLAAIVVKLSISQTAVRRHLKRHGVFLWSRGGSKPKTAKGSRSKSSLASI